MSADNTQRKEVTLDNQVVAELNKIAASMKPQVKVKRLMEMIIEDAARGRNNDDSNTGTPVAVAVKHEPKPEQGVEPSMLELELQRQTQRKHINLVKLESKLANSLPSNQYREIMTNAVEPETETKESICQQLRSRFPHITNVLTAANQLIEDMSIKVCDTHVILGDHLCEYMISYDYK